MIGGFIGNPIGGVINVSNIVLSITSGSYAITGQSAASGFGVVVTAGSYTINGSVAAFLDKRVSVSGSYVITGQSAAFNAKELAAGGAYTISGVTVTFVTAMVCAPGAYTITGSPASFSQVINGAGGGKTLYRGKLEVARRKIRIVDDEGRARRVDMLRHLKPPPPFTGPAPAWVLGDVPDIAPQDEAPLPIAPVLPAPRLPQSLAALQDARDENELIAFLTNTPDPLVEDIRQVLCVLAASGQLEQFLETA
jgi:hypothetical protein